LLRRFAPLRKRFACVAGNDDSAVWKLKNEILDFSKSALRFAPRGTSAGPNVTREADQIFVFPWGAMPAEKFN
jgi:hypothetical protein